MENLWIYLGEYVFWVGSNSFEESILELTEKNYKTAKVTRR
jgi:hypothetical protein